MQQIYNYSFKGYAFKVGTIGIKIKLICNIDIKKNNVIL